MNKILINLHISFHKWKNYLYMDQHFWLSMAFRMVALVLLARWKHRNIGLFQSLQNYSVGDLKERNWERNCCDTEKWSLKYTKLVKECSLYSH